MKKCSLKLIVLLLIAIAMTAGYLSSCVSNPAGGDVTSSEKDVPSGDDPYGIPYELYFDGAVYSILTPPRSEADAYRELYMDFDEENLADTINDAVYRRNGMVEERFGISLEVSHASSWTTAVSTLSDLVMADTDYYDLACVPGAHAGPAVANGIFMDLNKLPYVDFAQPYWDQRCYERLSIAHKNYLMVGDLSMSTLEGAHVTYFNKQMLLDNNIHDDIYQMVRDNTWTFDKMLSYIKLANHDVDDGTRNELDTYGVFNFNFVTLLVSFGYSLTEKNADDIPALFEMSDALDSDFSTLREVGYNQNYTFDPSTMLSSSVDLGNDHIWGWTRSHMFTNDQIMFMYGGFAVTELLKNMKSDYGIVPNAKLRENDEYACTIDMWTNMICVPRTNTDFDFVGSVLEYMTAVSTDTVRDKYIETVMKAKRNRLDGTDEMIDIITKSLHYEISDTFQLGGRDLIIAAGEKNSLARTYNKYSAPINTKINDLVEQINDLE